MIILSDVHGCFLTMKALLDKIPQEEKDKGIAICGDMIDRGPRSMEIIQYAMDNGFHCIRGNHEDMMLEFVAMEEDKGTDVTTYPNFNSQDMWWLGNGGFDTMNSYEIREHYDEDGNFWPVPKREFQGEVFKKHIEWLISLPYYLEFEDIKNDKGQHLLLTHSSANRVWKWDEQRRKDNWNEFVAHIVWGRPDNIRPIDGVYNVFGHTPLGGYPKIRQSHANIDTGACYIQEWAEEAGMGVMTALQFPEMIVYQQKNIDYEQE